MTKQILMDYIDACELIKETEQEIRKLKKKKQTVIIESVKGSNPDFPYQAKNFHMSGGIFEYQDDQELRRQEQILKERKEKAKKIRMKVEEWMNTIPMRMQRIIKYKIFEELTWEQAAAKIGRRATGDSVRMEFNKFMKNTK